MFYTCLSVILFTVGGGVSARGGGVSDQLGVWRGFCPRGCTHPRRPLQWTVRILLECILVKIKCLWAHPALRLAYSPSGKPWLHHWLSWDRRNYAANIRSFFSNIAFQSCCTNTLHFCTHKHWSKQGKHKVNWPRALDAGELGDGPIRKQRFFVRGIP